MKIGKRLVSFLLVFLMMFSLAIPASAATTIKLNKTSTTIYVGSSTTLKVTGTTKKVTWSTSKKSVATVSSKGKVTGKKAGTATIKAKVAGKTLSCKVTVKKVALSKTKVTLNSGQTTTIKLNGGTIKSVKSSKTSVATITKAGKITAKNAGTATITVTSTKNKKYTCKVTVKACLSATSVTLALGDYTTISLKGATLKSFKSSSTSVATITKAGKITAKKKGSATITATDTKGKKYTCKVKVEAPAISATSLTLGVGDTATLKLNGNTQKVTWSSSNTDVATVTSKGKVTAQSGGTATIKAKVGHKTYSCAVTVNQTYQRSYTVTFDSNGGSSVTEQAIYEGNCAYEPETPVREGYVFDGWYTDSELTQPYDFSTPVTADLTLYAKWVELSVDISLTVNTEAENISNRTVTGSVSTNGEITGVHYALVSTNHTTEDTITLNDDNAFELAVLLEDDTNTLTVAVDTADGTSTEESLTLTYDSGEVYDLAQAADPDNGWLILKETNAADVEPEPEPEPEPETPTEETPEDSGVLTQDLEDDAETTIYYAANLLNLYFTDDTDFSTRTAFVEETLGGSVAGYLNSLDMVQVRLTGDTLPVPSGVEYTGETSLAAITVEELQTYADALAASCEELESADVEHIYTNMTAVVDSNDPWGGSGTTMDQKDSNAWWLYSIGGMDAWDFDNYYNLDYLTNITLGVVDSGFQDDHPDLNGKVDVISSEDSAHDHGTHVAGIIAATADNGEGIAGLTHNNATILGYDVRSASATYMSDSDIQSGLTKTVEGGAKVINFSLGCSNSVSGTALSDSNIKDQGKSYSKVMGKLLSKGHDFVVVQSAGNGNENYEGIDYINNGGFCSITSDNCYSKNTSLFGSKVSQSDIMDRILVVSAIGQDNLLTEFSNGGTGDLNEIAAPGDTIYSCITGSTYKNKSGTSMAAPIVTGVCGLAWSANKALSGAQVVDLVMENTSGTAGTSSSDLSHTTGGMGIVDANLAVSAAIRTRGTSYGTVVDATTSNALTDATVKLHKGDQDGPLAGNNGTYSCDSNGRFDLPELPLGTYTMEISAEGYVTKFVTWTIVDSGITDGTKLNRGTFALTPLMDDGEYQIVLRWGETPSDLDSHLVANQSDGSSYHVYYSNKNPSPAYANLDVDDTSSYGPETVTITSFSSLYNIKYAVHDYTNRGSSSSTALANSGATVDVYKGSQLLRSFSVPTNKEGTEWDVFAFDANGNIVVTNSMTYCSDPASVLSSGASTSDVSTMEVELKDYEKNP